MKILSVFGNFLRFIKKWLWIKPTSKPDPAKATDAARLYVVIDYRGQKINLRKTEVMAFHALSRKDKRAMAQRFESMERKGLIRFEKIKGHLVAVKNKDYEAKADIRQ